GGVDLGAEERAVGRPLSGVGAGVSALRRIAAAPGLCRRFGALRTGAARQDGDGDAARRAARHFVVAARAGGMEARRGAARAVVRARYGCGAIYGVRRERLYR